MLQKLREKTSGWIATVILGLLIVPFAFFGMESYLSQRVETYAARISQAPAWWPSAPDVWPVSKLYRVHDISTAEFRQRFERARADARARAGDAFDPKAFESVENKRRILDELIDEQVMRLSAEADGIVAGDGQVRATIQAIPDFQVNGRFDPDRYQMLLAAQNPPQTPLDFERKVREDLQMGLVPSRLGLSAFVTDSELDRVMRLLGEKRDVSWVAMPPVPADTAPVTAEQIQAWYKAHQGEYRRPETVRIEYVEIDGSTLPVAPVDEAALRKRYEEQSAKFSTAEQREVSHILVQVAANASDAEKKAAEARANKLAADARAPGADFAALARANSDDAGSKGNGGDLGWMAKDSLPAPFAEAAFSMQAGEVRGPVKTDFGWHVIRVNDIRAGDRQPFEAVRDQLAKELQESERERAFNDLSGKLVDAVYKNPTSLEPAARALGLEVHTTPAFSRAGGPGIAGDAKVLRAAFSDLLVQDGTASDPIELGPSHSVLIRVVDHEPESALPLSAVSDAVVAAIRADRQRRAAAAAADALVAAAKAKGLPAAAAEAGLAMARMDAMPRSSAIPSRPAVEAFFAVGRPEGNAIPVGKVDAGGQFVVYAIRGVHDGDLGQVTAEEREQLRQQFSTAAGIQAQEAFVRAARARYQVKVAEDRL